MEPVSWLLLLPVRAYRKFVSPFITPRCRYYPTCSTYFVDAVQIHGPFKGLMLGVWRVLRCNPWSKGGVDHVPERGLWHPPEWIPPDDWPGHDLDGE